MAVPTKMADLSATAGSNSPAGTDAIGNSLDDYLRAVQAVVRLEQSISGSTIASAATVDLSTVNERSIQVTGTTGITGLGTVSAGIEKELRFAGALTITHSASLYLPGAANLSILANDIATFRSLGSGNWVLIAFTRGIIAAGTVTYAQIQNVSATDKVLGRSTAGAGSVEEIACTASGRAMIAAASAAAQAALLPLPVDLVVSVSDETTAITTGTAKITFRAPRAMTLSKIKASLSTVSSSGLPTFDVKKNGSTVFSTLLTIDASEKTSETAATPAVLSTTAIAADDEITIDITVAGTGAKGAKLTFVATTP